MTRLGLVAGAISLGLLALDGSAHAACKTPNPNLWGPPYVDGCALPASALNNFRAVSGYFNASKTTAITADGSPGTGISRTDGSFGLGAGYSAEQIYEWSIGPGTTPAPSYDGLRGVAVNTVGSTVLDVNGVGGYVVNNNARSGPAQVSSGLKGIAVCSANNSSCWGVSTILSDNKGIVASAGTGKALYNEFDYQVTSADTTVGILIGAQFVAQPKSAGGVTFLTPNGASAALSRWQYAFGTQDGASTAFAHIGALQTSGASINSQELDFTYFNSGSVSKTTTIAATDGGVLVANTGADVANSWVLSGAAVFATGANGGMTIASNSVVSATATTLSLGSAAGLTGGTIIGNVSNTTSILGSTIKFAGVTGVSCDAGAVTAVTVVVTQGLVTHC